MAYHPLVCRFMLFLQGDSSNSEYKQRFQDKVDVIETYNGGGTVHKSPGETAREIKILGLDPDIKEDVKKARASA